MRDEEKIIRMNTLKDFGRELGRDGCDGVFSAGQS